MPTLDQVMQACEELGRSLAASQPSTQLRIDRAREVALKRAVNAFPVPELANLEQLTRYLAVVKSVADGFLPFLLG